MNIELLKRLTEAHGVPGQEDAIREIVRKELKGICDISVDLMGTGARRWTSESGGI